jgi:hypothetical protein
MEFWQEYDSKAMILANCFKVQLHIYEARLIIKKTMAETKYFIRWASKPRTFL